MSYRQGSDVVAAQCKCSTQCGRELTAGRDDNEITCPACRDTHNIDDLIARLLNQTNELPHIHGRRTLPTPTTRPRERAPPHPLGLDCQG